jgi:16S rRNA (adenine1518-N6/adenine1519-N6)-dimethyltransferase
MTVPDPRTLLKKYGLAAKKSWGQNFLVDERVYEAIVRACALAPDDWAVEIGAGLGTLTARLLDAVPDGRLVAVERERDMLDVLEKELGGHANLELRAENALTFDLPAVAARAGRRLVAVGNLPYQIAAPLIFHLLAARAHLSRIVIMLQKEMADRLVAAPDTDAYGALGVMVSLHADVRLVVRARAGAFHPAPKVESAVVCLTPLATPRFPVDEAAYGRVVHAAFGQRRKTLRNALRAVYSDEAIDAALDATHLDGRRRGETLSPGEMALLAGALGAPDHA